VRITDFDLFLVTIRTHACSIMYHAHPVSSSLTVENKMNIVLDLILTNIVG
jgi:hypothetical protein